MTSILIISSTVAIAVSFLCSMAEALLLSFNPLTLNRLQAARPRAAESWRRLKKNVARPITAFCRKFLKGDVLVSVQGDECRINLISRSAGTVGKPA